MSDRHSQNGSRRAEHPQTTPSPKAANNFHMILSQRKRTKNTPKLPRSPILPLQANQLSGNEVLAKKRLVEQFYMPKSEPSLKAQSYSDLVTAFRQGLPVGDSPGREYRQDDILQWLHETQESFMELAREGKVEYYPIDSDIQDPTKVTEMLLGVDEDEGNVEILDRLVLALESSALALERRFDKNSDITRTPKEQLDMLTDYLRKLSREVEDLHQEISETTLRLKSHFRLQLQTSVQKLDKLDEMLKELTVRLDDSRKRMQNSKEVMTEDMAEKIAVLEFVAKRFNEYDQTVRQRRITQLTFFLCFVIVGVILYGLFQKFK